MSLLEKYIEYDKKLDEIFDFFNREDNINLKKGKRNQVISKNAVRNFNGKIDIFEQDEKIYKVLTVWEFKRLEAVYILGLEVLNLFEIFLKYKIEYKGNNLVIISQEKINIFNSDEEVEKYLSKKLTTFNSSKIIYSSRLGSNFNFYFNSKMSNKKYEKLINLINFFNTKDLSIPNNYGVDKNETVKCVDLDNFNYQISFIELKEFINLNCEENNFSEIINKYP